MMIFNLNEIKLSFYNYIITLQIQNIKMININFGFDFLYIKNICNFDVLFFSEIKIIFNILLINKHIFSTFYKKKMKMKINKKL